MRVEKKERGLCLQKRDLEVLKFCLEMRFSDLESLYQRFFLITKEGEKSQSDWWARERIGLLRRHGFLISQRLTFTGLSYYLATEKAHIALENLYDSHGSFVRY